MVQHNFHILTINDCNTLDAYKVTMNITFSIGCVYNIPLSVAQEIYEFVRTHIKS